MKEGAEAFKDQTAQFPEEFPEDPDFSIFPILQLISGGRGPSPYERLHMSIKDSVPVLPRINSYPDMSTMRRRRSSSGSSFKPTKAKSMINLWDYSSKGTSEGGRRTSGRGAIVHVIYP